MDIPTIHPPRLKDGATIAIIAPAGPIESRTGLDQGIATLKRMGFQVRFEDRIFQSNRYLAGSDSDRAEELMQAFENPEIQAIISLRGGYGCARLIPALQEKRLRSFPKIFMGFSDLTTLHMFFRRRLGWITFHGPMAASLGNPPQDQIDHLYSLWTDPDYRPTFEFPQLETWNPGVAEGELTGGCLSIVTSSLGTCYEIDTEGKILFLEELGEPPYRLDRMLTHLRLAGKLEKAAGLLLGNFFNCDPDQHDSTAKEKLNYTAKDVLQQVLQDLPIPILSGFPAGHSGDNWAIPLGTRVRVNADHQTVQLLDSAVC
jgi:muramoyltetrapeptide carboxypeptidase